MFKHNMTLYNIQIGRCSGFDPHEYVTKRDVWSRILVWILDEEETNKCEDSNICKKRIYLEIFEFYLFMAALYNVTDKNSVR